MTAPGRGAPTGAGTKSAPVSAQPNDVSVDSGPTTVTWTPIATKWSAMLRTCPPIPPVVGPMTSTRCRSSGTGDPPGQHQAHRRAVEHHDDREKARDTNRTESEGDADTGGRACRRQRRTG